MDINQNKEVVPKAIGAIEEVVNHKNFSVIEESL